MSYDVMFYDALLYVAGRYSARLYSAGRYDASSITSGTWSDGFSAPLVGESMLIEVIFS